MGVARLVASKSLDKLSFSLHRNNRLRLPSGGFPGVAPAEVQRLFTAHYFANYAATTAGECLCLFLERITNHKKTHAVPHSTRCAAKITNAAASAFGVTVQA
jgi:hypothetical protein